MLYIFFLQIKSKHFLIINRSTIINFFSSKESILFRKKEKDGKRKPWDIVFTFHIYSRTWKACWSANEMNQLDVSSNSTAFSGKMLKREETAPLEKQYRYMSSYESSVSHWPNTSRCYRRFPGESIALQKLTLAL